MPRPGTPSTRPGQPGNRPGVKPGQPGNRPGVKPGQPGNRPGVKPGQPGNRPGVNPGRPGNRPGVNPGRPGNRPGVNPGRPGTLPVRRPDFNRPGNGRPGSGNKNWWNSGNKINIGSGNTNININNNFSKSLNWSTNRRNWGGNPWWNRPSNRRWYGGSWNCGWNNRYYRHNRHYWGGYRPLPGYYNSGPSAGQVIGWGLIGWGLGKLIFDSGYNSYSNPYPVQPVPTTTGAPVTYSQPITVIAAEAPEQSEQVMAAANESSEEFVVKSQAYFKEKNYLAALESANEAIAVDPTDGALHEYRALVLFALGKYGEAAGVLNPVLASGPGWDWTTMVTLYDSQETYTTQLQKLEKYSKSKPDDGATHFLLGYHYMVCGYLEAAATEFGAAAKLVPADNVSSQLADLCSASSTSADQDKEAPAPPPAAGQPTTDKPTTETDEPEVEPAAKDPIPLDKLAGTWVSDKGKDGTITLTLKDGGKFNWNFTKDGKSNEFGGEYTINDTGMLVLDTDDTQMIAIIELPKDSEMTFVLSGGPPQDPGLDFKKKA